jgi:predicted DNA-binding transcriptional regulator AlpA
MKSLENVRKAEKRKQPELLTARQGDRLMRLALKQIPKPPPAALPYYTMGDVMRLTGFTHSQIYDGVRQGSLPRWKKTGWPAQQWDREAIDVWLAARREKNK